MNAGWELKYLESELFKRSHDVAARAKAPRAGWCNTLAYEWSRVEQQPPRPRQLSEKQRTVVANLQSLIDDSELWRSRAEMTEREVLRALLTLANRFGLVSFPHDLRSLGLRVGMSHQTVGRAAHRLRDKGLINFALQMRATGQQWELRAPGQQWTKSRTGGALPHQVIGPPLATLRDDDAAALWSSGWLGKRGTVKTGSQREASIPMGSGALGKRCLQICELLAMTPRTSREIADALGLKDARKVRRYHLARLEQYGLVVQADDGKLWRLSDVTVTHLRSLAMSTGAIRAMETRRRTLEEIREARREAAAEAVREAKEGPAPSTQPESWDAETGEVISIEHSSTEQDDGPAAAVRDDTRTAKFSGPRPLMAETSLPPDQRGEFGKHPASRRPDLSRELVSA